MASKVVKSALWYTLSTFLVRGIGFITMPIFTRLMTPTDFGMFSNYQSWVAVFTVLTTMQLGASLISAKADYKENLEQYCLTLVVAEEAAALLWLVVATIFARQIESLLALDSRCVSLIFVYLVFYPGTAVFQMWERYRYGYKKTVALGLLLAVSTAALSVSFVIFWDDGLMARVIGQIIPTAVIGTALTLFFWRRGKRPDFAMLRYALPIAIPLIPHMLAGVALGSFDKVMITWWRGPEETALYSVAYSCGLVVHILATSMNQAYAPWIGDMVTSGNKVAVRRKSKLYVAVFVAGAVILMLLAPELMWILGGDAYMGALYAMPAISLGSIFQFLYTLYVNIEMRLKKTVGVAVATVCAAAINVILNIIFIPTFGFIAAAYTTAVGYGCLLLFHFLIVRRMGYQEYYSSGFVAAIAASATAFALLVNAVYTMPVVRYVSCAIGFAACCAIAFRHRDKIMSYIGKKGRKS